MRRVIAERNSIGFDLEADDSGLRKMFQYKETGDPRFIQHIPPFVRLLAVFPLGSIQSEAFPPVLCSSQCLNDLISLILHVFQLPIYCTAHLLRFLRLGPNR
jgi:hypothetical protein